MAKLRLIRYTPHRCSASNERIEWVRLATREPIDGLPQIIWDDSTPWREANLWAIQRATENELSIETVRSNMGSLLQYASWLELSGTNWWDFPIRKADRCLVRYRGFLIRARDNGDLAPSTTTQRMRDVISFYRWLKATGLLSSEWPLWNDKTIGIRLPDSVGLERTITVKTTDLAIKNRKSNTLQLEDGLLPVSSADRDELLAFAKENTSWEIFLLLTLGFFTGMRIGTLCDLKIETIKRAFPEPDIPNYIKYPLDLVRHHLSQPSSG